MMNCPCKKPDSGQRIYDCEVITEISGVATRMTPDWCKLYVTREDYHKACDEGHGPGQAASGSLLEQSKKRRPTRCPENKSTSGLGDRVEQALTAVGITSKRVEQWLGRPCGCAERREKLNRLGAWVSRVLKGKTDDAQQHLDRIIDDT